jgi:uncharacterized protein YyaL (SSP411 family)
VVIAGDPSGEAAATLAALALAAPDPVLVVLRVADSASLPQSHPAYGKSAGGADASAFVCRRGTCSLPVTDAPALAALVRQR